MVHLEKYENRLVKRTENKKFIAKISKLEFWYQVVFKGILLPLVLSMSLAFTILRFIGALVLLIGIILSIILGMLKYKRFKIYREIIFNFKNNELIISEHFAGRINAKKYLLFTIKYFALAKSNKKGFQDLYVVFSNGQKLKLFSLHSEDTQLLQALRDKNLNIKDLTGAKRTLITEKEKQVYERALKRRKMLKSLDKVLNRTFIILGTLVGLLLIPLLIPAIIYWIVFLGIIVAEAIDRADNVVKQMIIAILGGILIIGSVFFVIFMFGLFWYYFG